MTIDAEKPTDRDRAQTKLSKELQVKDAVNMVKDKHLIEDHLEHKESAEHVYDEVLNKTYTIAGNITQEIEFEIVCDGSTDGRPKDRWVENPRFHIKYWLSPTAQAIGFRLDTSVRHNWHPPPSINGVFSSIVDNTYRIYSSN